jgi:hypothetical protein
MIGSNTPPANPTPAAGGSFTLALPVLVPMVGISQ